MKLINAFCAIATLLFCSHVWADNCTIDKKVELVRAGYSKADVEKMCNATPECCCSYETFEPSAPHGKKQYYVWMVADKCAQLDFSRRVPTMMGVPMVELSAPSCTSASYCGRSENSEFLPTSIHTSQSSKTNVLAKLFKEAKTQ